MDLTELQHHDTSVRQKHSSVCHVHFYFVSLRSNILSYYSMSFTSYTLGPYIVEALPVTSAIKHVDTQLCVYVLLKWCLDL